MPFTVVTEIYTNIIGHLSCYGMIFKGCKGIKIYRIDKLFFEIYVQFPFYQKEQALKNYHSKRVILFICFILKKHHGF